MEPDIGGRAVSGLVLPGSAHIHELVAKIVGTKPASPASLQGLAQNRPGIASNDLPGEFPEPLDRNLPLEPNLPIFPHQLQTDLVNANPQARLTLDRDPRIGRAEGRDGHLAALGSQNLQSAGSLQDEPRLERLRTRISDLYRELLFRFLDIHPGLAGNNQPAAPHLLPENLHAVEQRQLLIGRRIGGTHELDDEVLLQLHAEFFPDGDLRAAGLAGNIKVLEYLPAVQANVKDPLSRGLSRGSSEAEPDLVGPCPVLRLSHRQNTTLQPGERRGENEGNVGLRRLRKARAAPGVLPAIVHHELDAVMQQQLVIHDPVGR